MKCNPFRRREHKNRPPSGQEVRGRDGSMRGRSESLTRVAHGAADRVLATGEEELHQPRRDEAARAGHAYALRRRRRRRHCLLV